MQERQSKTFKLLLSNRVRQARKLETLLAFQHTQRAQLAEVEQAKQIEVFDKSQEQAQREAHLAQMMHAKTPIKIEALNAQRQYREIVVEQRAQLEQELSQLQQTVKTKDDEIHHIQRDIAKNKAEIESYQKLLDKLQRHALRAAEEAMDEAAGEALAAQRRLKEKAEKERLRHG